MHVCMYVCIYTCIYIYIYIYIVYTYIISLLPGPEDARVAVAYLRWLEAYYYVYCYGRVPKFHRVSLGRDLGTLKSDIVSKKHPQLIYPRQEDVPRNPKSYPHSRLQGLPRWKKTTENTRKQRLAWRQESGVGISFWLLAIIMCITTSNTTSITIVTTIITPMYHYLYVITSVYYYFIMLLSLLLLL